MEILVSVIMPVYNQEKYLTETIESVINQSYENFEFLILDDGSTDSSAEIIKEYAFKDSRIKSFYEQNSGKCNATNKLVNLANGSYCAFLDADDCMFPDRLEKQIAFHKENSAVDASSCHCYYINDDGKFLGIQKFPYLRTIDDCVQTIRDNKIILCAFTGLMTTKICYVNIGGLKHQYWPCEDIEFLNRIIETGYYLIIIQESLMKYRVHSSSITNSNLWHSLVDMTDYTHYCIYSRREGKEATTFSEFMKIRENDKWWIKLNRFRLFYARTYHKEAGFYFYLGNYPMFSFKFLMSFLLDPKFIIVIIKNKLK